MAHIIVFAITSYIFLSPALAHAVEPESGLSLGYKAYQNGSFEKAVEYLESAKKDDFIISDYTSYYLGEAYLSLNRFDEALNAFDACIKYHIKSPLAPLALEKIGDVYLTKGNIINSINTYKAFLAEYPDNSQTPYVLYKLISILISNNMLDEAIPFIRRLLVEFPQQEYSDFSNLKMLYHEIKKLDAD
ncbi:MAG: tetratricopeptide repeat protein [Deltaproteobacteria bacterium]|nr:tetratricopeptide repeat protein [Deltaproteobacteria bacterium]